jgi:opacity protein-like surface antigen
MTTLGRCSCISARLVTVFLLGLLSVGAPSPSVAQLYTPEEERARERDAEARRQRLAQEDRESDRARRSDSRHPSELYVAGFGGYTFGHGINDVDGTGLAAGNSFGNIGLKNSGVYGGKLGYFLPDRLNWLGLEIEGFNTTPHIKESSFATSSHLRVTTLAFNAIVRAKMMCDYDQNRRSDSRTSAERDSRHDFCRLQPYVGAGLGLFFAKADNVSDNAAPGLNALAGVRYYITRGVAVFGEYKYNRVNLDFDNLGGSGAGLSGTYSASHVVGGLSFHF